MIEGEACVCLTRKKQKKYRSQKNPISFFLYHSFMPLSNAIYADLLIGNIPGCFSELRLIVETLGKCYYADLEYSDSYTYREKLERLEGEINKEDGPSIAKILRNVGKKASFRDKMIALWSGLSEDWLHTEGVAKA
ncbi:hypothetical protein AKJ64_02315 [candidate division MSBL1 archaeon SCGC-AAA259E17]|uniref:Uncharacterized protein n=1 Tax=candidate division MSBL1 archaeon SCGC-AAA259E17 TaxID=1698263 RepID=A0A133UF83_9EURY|nr:hypothetical protein AKJ64_02315 [candidate division MSBL1 archaeon SCGC-AAA259E17]